MSGYSEKLCRLLRVKREHSIIRKEFEKDLMLATPEVKQRYVAKINILIFYGCKTVALSTSCINQLVNDITIGSDQAIR